MNRQPDDIRFLDLTGTEHHFETIAETIGFLSLQNPTGINYINSQIKKRGLVITGSGSSVVVSELSEQKDTPFSSEIYFTTLKI